MTTIDPVTRAQLIRLSTIWRKRAHKVGPMHAWWDYIFDVESVLKGEQTAVVWTPEQLVTVGREGLIKYAGWTEEKLDKEVGVFP